MAWGREKQDPMTQITPIQAMPWSRDILCFIGCITTWWITIITSHDCTLARTDSLSFNMTKKLFTLKVPLLRHYKWLHVSVCKNTYLVSINSNSNQCKNRDMNRTILCKAAHMAHRLPKHPCTVNKPHLKEHICNRVALDQKACKKHTCSPLYTHREMSHAPPLYSPRWTIKSNDRDNVRMWMCTHTHTHTSYTHTHTHTHTLDE